MTLTPTDKGAGIAGIALASIGWFSLFKLNHVAKLLGIGKWVSSDGLFEWITRSTSNKMLTLLATEVFNFGVHGISNPSSVLFATGSTIVNVFMIFIGLPLRRVVRSEQGLLSDDRTQWQRIPRNMSPAQAYGKYFRAPKRVI